MNKKVRVALNMSRYSVPQKINKAKFIVDTMMAAGPLFPGPVPNLATVSLAINNLETAWNDAEDGGKQKTAFMHAKEDDLMTLLHHLANYVERIADGDEEIVISAGMDVKKPGQIHIPEFSVEHTEHPGEVMLRVKSRVRTMYRWEHCKDPMGQNAWTGAKVTTTCTTNIQDLEPATKYWFRVTLLNKLGETAPYDPVCIIVC